MGPATTLRQALSPDLLDRKKTHFVLWLPGQVQPAPRLIIGQSQPGNPPTLVHVQQFDLRPSSEPDLWEYPANAARLVDGGVYHYWFEVTDTNVYLNTGQRIWCTDPTAWTVDWRHKAPLLDSPYRHEDRDPAAVAMYQNGELAPCDPGGETVDWTGDQDLDGLPANNRLVIYELPTCWSSKGEEEGVEIGVGTFRDAIALIDKAVGAANFARIAALGLGKAPLADLGINALELLPPADSFVSREWGYATSNYFAPDYDLGFPAGHASPTASSDLTELVKKCHGRGIRFFVDVVMAFATRAPYQNVNFLDFHVQSNAGDPEEYSQGKKRNGFGGDLFKYNYWRVTYDPVFGKVNEAIAPARQLMKAYIARWMLDFHVDGIRMDSVENIANWDFVHEFKDYARFLWRNRHGDSGHTINQADERFLVVGEELAVPLDLLRQNRLDALWNEHFQRMVRSAILGQNESSNPSFESTVRKMIDCRLLGFSDGAQAVNYVTSHDVEGWRKERLFNFLTANGVIDTEKRIKLAFACLLTAVGVPMILAGEEFADQHDKPVISQKQTDPVNYDRLEEAWRKRIFDYVARLVKLRTSYGALAVNETDFIHVDFNEGKRVVVWLRGQASTGELVVVVANFSDWGTPNPTDPNSEYVVPNWPIAPAGKHWKEVTQDRDVPSNWVGREPIYPWEAKVYVLEN